MDVRLFGAGATVVAGLCALVFVGVVVLAPAPPHVDAPSEALLVARSDGADELTPLTNPSRLRSRTPANAIPSDAPPPVIVPNKAMASYGTPGRTGTDTLTSPSPVPNADPPIPVPATPKTKPPVSASDPSAIGDQPAIPKAAAPPKPAPPRVVDHKYDHVFTMDEIKRLKTAMRLSPDQEHFWGPVAGLLRDIGRQQIAKIDAGQKPEFDTGFDMMQRFYSAASPLLQTLREDQKAEIRRRATEMGLGAYASYI